MTSRVIAGDVRAWCRPRLVFIFVALSIVILSSSGVAVANSSGLGSRLLGSSDLPSGWLVGPGSWKSLDGCAALPTASEVVGKNGVESVFHRGNGSAVLTEYAVLTASIIRTFEKADNQLSNSSCSERSSGSVTYSSSLANLFNVPTYGDWSIGEFKNVVILGVKFQQGYVLVRKGNLLLVVGYTDHGVLAKRALEKDTKEALAKLLST